MSSLLLCVARQGEGQVVEELFEVEARISDALCVILALRGAISCHTFLHLLHLLLFERVQSLVEVSYSLRFINLAATETRNPLLVQQVTFCDPVLSDRLHRSDINLKLKHVVDIDREEHVILNFE